MINSVVSFVIIVLIVWFFISNTKRKKQVVIETLKNNFKKLLQSNIDYYNNLDHKHQLLFEDRVRSFLEEINIEGVGIEVTDKDRIMIAASAIIPIFGFQDWRYKNLTSVILYPDTFNHDFQFDGDGNRNILGMVGSGYMNGQMILSKAALIKGFSKNNGKENTAIHEFVHLVDGTDGTTDGIPQVSDSLHIKPWLQMMHKEIGKIKNGHSDINPYAATSEAEFLAVASEYFFEKPKKFQKKHPELYKQLASIFSQQPPVNN